jgi:hypothetical protein
MNWSRLEVEAVVADYFAMLRKELAGLSYDKTEHRRRLQPLLKNRSHGSIEFKHQNISAVLINFDQPYISGYKPRQNYQLLLEQVVLEHLESDRQLAEIAMHSPVLDPSGRPIPSHVDVAALIEEPPDTGMWRPKRAGKVRPPMIVDFVERDARNRELGRRGEEWALDLEQRRLHDTDRRPDLAKRVEWVAQTMGDGLGYDIASFNADGSARLIEVKTTGLGKHFPFHVTANELRVSKDRRKEYHLYRVFEFGKAPQMYQLRGALDDVCRLDAQSFVARVR